MGKARWTKGLSILMCIMTAASLTACASSVISASSANDSASAAADSTADSSAAASAWNAPDANSVWADSLTKYRADDTVNHLIFVQWTKGTSDAEVQVYEKYKSWNNSWTIALDCDAYVGKKGCTENKKEGDACTPIGDFGVTTAFGIRQNPGTQLSWIDVTEDLWCPDSEVSDYNKIVSSKNGGTAEGEHLIEYSPQYNYAMFLDYNKEGTYPAGSAIFFHCMGQKKYTGGCVAVSEENMKYILTVFGKNDRVIIAPYLA